MLNQGYRPPNQPMPPRTQSAWQAPPAYGMPGSVPPTAAKAPRQRAGRPSKASQGGGAPRPPKRRSLKWQLIKVLLLLLVLAGAGAGIYVWKTQADVRPYTSVFVDNVFVDGINLSGMTWEEGTNAVLGQINNNLGSWYVRLRSPAGEFKDITAQMLGINRDPTQALEQAWMIGHETSTLNRKNIFQLKEEIDSAKRGKAEYSSIELSADTSPIDTILETLAKAAYVAPQNAAVLSFDPDNTTQPFTFQPEVVGKRLDVAALKAQILSMVETFTPGEVLVQPEDVQPDVTLASLQPYYSLRYRAITPIDAKSTDERNQNIRVAFSRINGMVLNDGERFSFNNVVGRRTEKNGFFQAFEYNYGELTPGWGGGVCQASTTVYLAAVQAGMRITDHTAHSTRVSYTDMGKDATVSDTRGREIDFSFRNNSGSKVFLSAHVIADPSNKKRLLCEVRVYGKDLGNTRYELETEVVEKLPAILEPEIIEDTKAKYVTYTDEEKTVIEPSEGFVVDTFLVTVTDGVQTDRSKIARSIYKNRAARIYVGVTPRGF
ncbi:MAG: VanW family protein [Candidatus Limiplasma sp.]|nr:VanW family protein [Candidatus Limiplasma sp.]MEA5145001.1 VanW family protein [Candidatus Limiplasma sp.]